MLDPGYGQFFANASYIFIGSIGIILFLLTVIIWKNLKLGLLELSIVFNIILFLYATYADGFFVKYLGVIIWPLINLALIIWYIIWKKRNKATKSKII